MVLTLGDIKCTRLFEPLHTNNARTHIYTLFEYSLCTSHPLTSTPINLYLYTNLSSSTNNYDPFNPLTGEHWIYGVGGCCLNGSAGYMAFCRDFLDT